MLFIIIELLQNICVQCESKKITPPLYDFCQFLPNGWEFLIEILHTYYAFKHAIDCQILSNYLQIKCDNPPNFIISKYIHREFY